MIDTTNTSTTGSYTYSSCTCVHRLPCGYCPLLSKPCPMQTITITNAQNTPVWSLNNCTNGTTDCTINKTNFENKN